MITTIKCFAENRNVNNPNLFEGDMILTPEQRYNAEHGKDVDGSSGRKRGSSKFPKWPDGVVVYSIGSTLGKLSLTTNQSRVIHVVSRSIEQFSIECHKTKTKVITMTNHISRKQSNEPIRTRSKYMRQTRENACRKVTIAFGFCF